MPEESLGTFEPPDLNMGRYEQGDVEAFSESAVRRRLRRLHGGSLSLDEEDRRVAVAMQGAGPGPDEPRIRIRRPPGGEWKTLRRISGNRRTDYQNGIVELVNQPDFDFDFRIRFELLEAADGAVLVPSAVAVIARVGNLSAVTPRSYSDAGVARAIRLAARALTRSLTHGETFEGRASSAEVSHVLARQPSRHRSSSAQADKEARAVAAHLRELRTDDGRLPRGYAAVVAARMGWNAADPAARERVRKRKLRAESLGLTT